MSRSINQNGVVCEFVDELVKVLVSQYAAQIDFILLYGSVVRGEFIKGSSDIDLIIQVTSDEHVSEVYAAATKIFWSLNDTYGMGFDTYLANSRAKSLMDSYLKKAEKKALLFTPIFVLGPNEMDWQHAKVMNEEWKLWSWLLVSSHTTFLKIKHEGQVLYGRDIRPLIPEKWSWWDRWKGLCMPVYLSLIAILIVPILRVYGVKYACKALIWDLDAGLIYLKKLVIQKKRQVEILQEESRLELDVSRIYLLLDRHSPLTIRLMSNRDFIVVERAMELKKHFYQASWSDSILFVWRVSVTVIRINSLVLIKRFIYKLSENE